MITLYTFGPAFGLPDPSPFVTKAEVLLKMAGVPYRTDTTGFNKAPKGKLPYIDDGGAIVADSTFIRMHLEKNYGVDFDKGLSPAERGVALAFEKLCEDHLYWVGLHARWIVDANFNKGPRTFFDNVPAPLRPLVVAMVRRQVRRNLWGHGMGRHTIAEMEQLAHKYAVMKPSSSSGGLDRIFSKIGIGKGKEEAMEKIKKRVTEIGIPFGIFQAYANSLRD